MTESMTHEQAERIVARGRPPHCRHPLHSHGTWGLAETLDKTCPEYRASIDYSHAVQVLAGVR